MWSTARARITHRLAIHIPLARSTLANDRPMVSFTFDDIPDSAATTGAPLLERYGARGTFYVIGSALGTAAPHWTHADAATVAALHARGHEIGCHTFTHQRSTELGAAAMAAEIDSNNRALHRIAPSLALENFAYPYGWGSFPRKRQLQRAYRSCRSIRPGINAGPTDLQFLRASPLIDCEIDRGEIDRAMAAARAANGWLIFYGHDVTAEPSPYGCTPELLTHALDAARSHDIAIVTVHEALERAGV
jgi:peptidoglycan/xylan/chitin deacetylase (PgdA/CDA1 family)